MTVQPFEFEYSEDLSSMVGRQTSTARVCTQTNVPAVIGDLIEGRVGRAIGAPTEWVNGDALGPCDVFFGPSTDPDCSVLHIAARVR